MYAFHAPEYEVEESKALLTQYYWEIFQIACLDVVREWLREYLQRKHSMYEKRFCSPAFGAGFYGMELSASEKMLQLMDAEKIGVSWDGGKMKPQMSVAGVYLISRKDICQTAGIVQTVSGSRQAVHFAVTIRKNELIHVAKNDKL